jgi:hypothetical protein
MLTGVASRGAAWLTIITESKADTAHDRGSEGQAIPTINAESATGEGMPHEDRSGRTMTKPTISATEGRGMENPLKGFLHSTQTVPRTGRR